MRATLSATFTQPHMVSQAVAILMLTKSPSDAGMAVDRIAVSYPPICEDLIVQVQASIQSHPSSPAHA